MSLTPQQRIERRAGLGASDAAAAIGLSKWQTPLQLYLEKIGQAPPDKDEDALHLEIGSALEPMIIERFARKQRIQVIDRQRKFVDPTWEKRWATADGIAANDGAWVEAKSVGIADPTEWGDELEDGAVPMIYYIQNQHSLACSGAPYAWLPVVMLNRQFRIYRIQRDEELIALMTKQEREFMRLVEARIPPPPVDLDDAKLMWPSHRENKRVDADEQMAGVVAALKDSKVRAKALEEAQEDMKLRIQKHMGDAAELVFCGKTICTWKQAKASQKFDEDRFATDQPVLYRQYLKDVPGSRRMLTK